MEQGKHTLKTFRRNIAAINEAVKIFDSEDYAVLINKSKIIFNDRVEKFFTEKISKNPDHFISLEEIRVIFSEKELMCIDFVFKAIKRQDRDFFKQSFAGFAFNYFVADILGIPKNHLQVFKLFLKEELDEKTVQLSLNKYSSNVCDPILFCGEKP